MARKKLKLPKQVGGMKLPKKARKIGNSVLAHPLGREILAGVLVTAGSAMLNRQSRAGSATRRFLSHPVASTRSAGGAVAGAGAEAVTTAGRTAGIVSTLILDALEGFVNRANGDTKAKRTKASKRNGRKSKRSAKKGRQH